MAAIVAKFGGTSLADAKQFKKVKDIVMADDQRCYVVPSAPGKRFPKDEKVTDLLYKSHKFAKKDPSAFEETFLKIVERFVSIKNELSLKTDIEAELAIIKGNLLSGESEDYAASRGEYLCGKLMAEYLGYEFVDPAEHVFFDEKGVFQSEKTKTILRGKLKNTPKAVVPGFYGSTPDGKIKTFSRGGSDITGSIVARAASAKLYENWTDVPGFLVADPRVVKNPQVIGVITYRELRELSYMGATVLHEDSIFPVYRAGIPINIKDTEDPSLKGTMIVPDNAAEIEPREITGIAGRKDFTVIAIEKSSMNREVGFGRKVLSTLEQNDISFEHMPTGIDTLSVVVEKKAIEHKITKVIDDIYRNCEPDSIEIFDNLALIATVGRGMIRSVGVAGKLFGALKDAKINVRMIDQGSSELNIIVGVENQDFEAAVNAIYRAFV